MKYDNFRLGVFRQLCFLFILFALPQQIEAETKIRYVSDQLVVRLKSSPNQPNTTVTTVRTDERLTVIQEQNEMVKVRTNNGEEGWIEKKYITSTLPDKHVIASLKTELENLKQHATQPASNDPNQEGISNQLRLQLEEMSKQNEQLNERVHQVERENKELIAKLEAGTTPLDDSASGLSERLTKERDALLAETARLTKENSRLAHAVQQKTRTDGGDAQGELAALAAENQELLHKSQQLERDRKIYWFLAGALVFFVGITMGLMFSRKKRRTGYLSL